MRNDLWRWSGFCALLLMASSAFAQKSKDKNTYDKAALATVLREAIVYVAADPGSQKVSLVTPGHEVVIVERSAPWVKVFANTDAQQEDVEDKPEFGDEAAPQPISGWI